ncbi:MAG: hypothetical protein AB7H93_25665 [Vicinamibacterales bacterium]
MPVAEVAPHGEAAPAGPRAVVRDRFETLRPRGRVLGSAAGDGSVRHGADVERVLEIDEGGLRVRTMAQSGWGRTSLVHGPLEPLPGRLLHVHLLNGHNTSDSSAVGPLWRRLARWLVGSETVPVWRRVLRYPRSRPREWLPRKLRYWLHNRDEAPAPLLENLLVGWSAPRLPSPASPGTSALVVRGTGPHNGELNVSAGGPAVPLFQGLQNLPFHHVAVVRPGGVLHLACSDYAGAKGLPAFPAFRPLAVDGRPLVGPAYAGVHQGATGQIGFSCDSRIYSIEVLDDGRFADWCGGACLADAFAARPGGTPRRAERGGWWHGTAGVVVDEGGAGPTADTTAGAGAAAATLWSDGPPGPFGLLRLALSGLGPPPQRLTLTWGPAGADRRRAELTATGLRLTLGDAAGGAAVVQHHWALSLDGGHHDLQLTEHAGEVVAVVDGMRPTVVDEPAVGAQADSPVIGAAAAASAGTVGADAACTITWDGGATARLARIEAYPATLPLADLVTRTVGPLEAGGTVVLEETFPSPTPDLAAGATGSLPWRRAQGPGRIEVPTAGAARYAADIDRPVAGRTIHLVGWDDPTYCDLELSAAASPDDGRPGRRSRAGLTVWQDDRNYFSVSIWLDEAYASASVSAFFTFRGFEDVYDAVWSNVGDLVRWDRPFRLRLLCDGRRFVALVGDEPVLYRALQDVHPNTRSLQIREVGMVSAWEWGHDTGSALHRFVARGRAGDTARASR